MATNQPVATYTIYATVLGVRHELSVTVRNIGNCDADALAGMTAHTIATWARVWSTVMRNETSIPDFHGNPWLSACQQKGVENLPSFDAHVTVWNEAWNNGGIGITVHSWDNGYNAMRAAYALLSGMEKMNEHFLKFDIDKFEFLATTPKAPQSTPKQGNTRDINDVDGFLHDTPPQTPQTGATQVKAFVRPAMQGTLQGTLKLEKGAKDKTTWETAIVATQPYSYNAVQYQEKDLVVYPITGAVKYDADSSGYYFVIPTENASIRIKVKEATQWNGQAIESDSQKLVKHLGITGELTQGMKWEVPATHIAMKVGKTNDKGEQFKNYAGLYELK